MQNKRGYAALTLTLLIWGSTFIVTKIVLREMGPLLLTELRFIIAFLALAPLAARQGFKLRDVFRPTFLWFGLTGTTLYYALQNLGLSYTSVSSTVLILSIVPAVTAVLAVIFLKERLGRQQVFGIILVTAGMILVGFDSANDTASSNPLLGNLLVLGSALSWAVYTIQGRKLVDSYPALVMTAASTGAGLLFLIPFTGWELASSGWPAVSGPAWLGILYLGLAASGLTMYLWNYALHFLPASVATPYVNLVPIIGIISAFWLGETPGWVEMTGGGLAIIGVLFSSMPQDILKIKKESR
ncbi:MAG: DMT family transporter [Anaerolineae bacterium]|nr:DMT family transporter [Anaerolineae bacterium]